MSARLSTFEELSNNCQMLNAGSNTGSARTNKQEQVLPRVKIAVYSLLQQQTGLSAASPTGLKPAQGSGFPVLQSQLSPAC